MSEISIEVNNLPITLEISSIISLKQPSTIKYLLNNYSDMYSHIFERHPPLTLAELFHIHEIDTKCAQITEFLICSILQRGVQEAPMPMATLAKITDCFQLLCMNYNHRPQDIFETLHSILLMQIASADTLSGILDLTALIKHITTHFKLDCRELLDILRNNFELLLNEFTLRKNSKDYIEALEWIIRCERCGLVSSFGKLRVLVRAIEFVQETHDHSGVNSALGIDLEDFGGASYVNGLLKLVEIEDQEIRNSRDLICKKYEARELIVIETLSEYSINISIKENNANKANKLVTDLREIELQRDCFRQSSNAKKTIHTCIYKGKIRRNDTIVAVKKITATNIIDLNKFLNERDILERLSGNKYFLEYYGSIHKDNSLYIIMEYIEKSLMDVMTSSRRELTEVALKAISTKLVEAYAYLESKKIFHRDVKPENILMRHGYDPVIIDFGISDYKDIEISPRSTVTSEYSIGGTLDYMSPEVFQAYQNRNSVSHSSLIGVSGESKVVINPIQSDVYSLGITLFQLYTGKTLQKYQGKSGNHRLLRSVDRRITIKHIKVALLNMLQYDPKTRPNFTRILAHLNSEKTVTN